MASINYLAVCSFLVFTANMASRKISIPLTLLFLLAAFSDFLLLEAVTIHSHRGEMSVVCIEVERNALLKFRDGLKDPSGRLSSWVGTDCCTRQGVGCNKQTGNVIKLDLRNINVNSTGDYEADVEALSSTHLGGQISDSLLHLKYLNYLDLSMNNFQKISIPSFLGSLEKLTYLNLSGAAFSGMIPPHLGNLSNLRHLDLFAWSSARQSCQDIWVSNINWLSGLSSLEFLNLGCVNLGKATTDWMQAVNLIPSLVELSLSGCQLSTFPQSLPFVNLTSLSVLDLSHNNFSTIIPSWLFNLSSLAILHLSHAGIKGPIPHAAWGNLCNFEILDLSGNGISSNKGIEFVHGLSTCSNSTLKELLLRLNRFHGRFPDSLDHFKYLRLIDLSDNELSGQLPDSLGNLKRLRSLDLSSNLISGPIPPSIGRLSLLEDLVLFNNTMNGTIPESIGQLEGLSYLNLNLNSWGGTISENHFMNLTKLRQFHLFLSPTETKQPLTFHVRPDWDPPFSLKSIVIGNCKLSAAFPAWLRTQKELTHITLKNVGISGKIPEWLWKISPQIEQLDLSRNQLGGNLPNSLSFSSSSVWSVVDLSSNRFDCGIPLWYNLACLLLRNNLLSGPIPFNIGELSSLKVLAVSGNLLNGSIPSSISKLKNLETVDLSDNHLSGKIPMHWNDLQLLKVIDLSMNKLFGGIPSSICSMPSLFRLVLGDNNLSGQLSASLHKCTGLLYLDLGNNRFSGEIPYWMGESMLFLRRLRLRGNMLTGNIPEQLCGLSHLHIMDLALNNLSGSIPRCLGDLTALNSVTLLDYNSNGHKLVLDGAHMELVVKGQMREFAKILPIVKLIDLSSNNFQGEIPPQITNLSTLGTLNLSRNQLTGKIPEKIGAMQGLETLDLSCNHLSGPIPPSMSSITSLNYLNLSHNLLSGPIPTTNQFQTFNDPSIYEGNPGLCGLPLSTKCSTPDDDHKDEEDRRKGKGKEEEQDEDGLEKSWFLMSMGLGFPVGFWAVCGSLTLKKSWRHAYFRFVEETKDKVYVFIAVNVARLRRKMERNRHHA